ASAARTPAAGANPPLGAARAAIARAVRQIDQARDASQAARPAPSAREAMHEAARELVAAAQAADPGVGVSGLADRDVDEAGEPSGQASRPPGGSAPDPPSRPGHTADTDLAE